MENLKRGDELLLRREKGKGELYSQTEGRLIAFNPPENELTINVRRDTKEFPYVRVSSADFVREKFQAHFAVAPFKPAKSAKEDELVQEQNYTTEKHSLIMNAVKGIIFLSPGLYKKYFPVYTNSTPSVYEHLCGLRVLCASALNCPLHRWFPGGSLPRSRGMFPVPVVSCVSSC
jgi:hypothetical protein